MTKTLRIFILGENDLKLRGEINFHGPYNDRNPYVRKAILPEIHTRESVLIFDSSYGANLTEKINIITKSTGIMPLFVFMYNIEDHKKSSREHPQLIFQIYFNDQHCNSTRIKKFYFKEKISCRKEKFIGNTS